MFKQRKKRTLRRENSVTGSVDITWRKRERDRVIRVENDYFMNFNNKKEMKGLIAAFI